MRETSIEIKNDGLTLRGTLTVPAGRAAPPAVLFIHGSGPLDRNENMKGQSLDVFNSLALSLAEAGYASLRYDKRGCGESEGDYFRTGHYDLVSDALAWVNHLKTDAAGHVGRIYLLGHSEGTLIAAQASRTSNAVAGLVLVCPFIQKVEDIMRHQALAIEKEYRNASGLSGWLNRMLARIAGQPSQVQARLIGRIKATEAPVIRFMLQKFEAQALRELMGLDPKQVYAEVEVPTLLLGGEKDIQCDPNDVGLIEKVLGGKATAYIEKNLTHILRKDEGPPAFLAYQKQLKSPIDPCVARVVVDWLQAQNRMSD